MLNSRRLFNKNFLRSPGPMILADTDPDFPDRPDHSPGEVQTRIELRQTGPCLVAIGFGNEDSQDQAKNCFVLGRAQGDLSMRINDCLG